MKGIHLLLLCLVICICGCAALDLSVTVDNNVFTSVIPDVSFAISNEFDYQGPEKWMMCGDSFERHVFNRKEEGVVSSSIALEIRRMVGIYRYYQTNPFRRWPLSGILKIDGDTYHYGIMVVREKEEGVESKDRKAGGKVTGLVKELSRIVGYGKCFFTIVYIEHFPDDSYVTMDWENMDNLTDRQRAFLEQFNTNFLKVLGKQPT